MAETTAFEWSGVMRRVETMDSHYPRELGGPTADSITPHPSLRSLS